MVVAEILVPIPDMLQWGLLLTGSALAHAQHVHQLLLLVGFIGTPSATDCLEKNPVCVL